MPTTAITVTATYLDASKNPAAGIVTITLSETVENTGDPAIYLNDPLPSELDTQGQLNTDGVPGIILIANDDPDTFPGPNSSPPATTHYTVDESKLPGGYPEPWDFTLSNALPFATVDLATLRPEL